jgi:hypothetical protein
MEEDKKIFEHEMEVAAITHKQMEEKGKQTKEEEIMLRGTDCILALKRYNTTPTRLNDGEIVKVVITRGK